MHQMGSSRARIFVPPFKNPPNPNVDPLVWSEVNLLGQAMATRFHEAGKSGVIWGEQYSGFLAGREQHEPVVAQHGRAAHRDRELASRHDRPPGLADRSGSRGPIPAT